MYLVLVAIAWVYVVLLMSMTEQTIVAGVMTLLLYCVIPLSIILYLMGTPQRKRRRHAAEKSRSITSTSSIINTEAETHLETKPYAEHKAENAQEKLIE